MEVSEKRTVANGYQSPKESRTPIPANGVQQMIGYARVSTADQHLGLQRDALAKAGCARVYADDGMSGTTTKRPQLTRALKALQGGDTLVVWRLDRLGRSLPHLIATIDELGRRGCNFRSITEAIDTTTAGGTLILHIMGALAQFERTLIVERTKAGLAAARRRGVHLGRKFALSNERLEHARQLKDAGESPTAIARTLGCSRSTVYASLSR
jgi:DNA invertase Pin-like site-specific DNA recombinase